MAYYFIYVTKLLEIPCVLKTMLYYNA